MKKLSVWGMLILAAAMVSCLGLWQKSNKPLSLETRIQTTEVLQQIQASPTLEPTSTSTEIPPIPTLPQPTATAEVLPSCGDRMDFFETEIIDRENMYGIYPLGNVWPPGHVFPTDHFYLSLLKSDPGNWDSAPIEMPVYAPGDIYVVRVTSQEHLYADPPYADYDLTFKTCREVTFWIGHMASLSPELMAVLEKPDRCDETIAGETRRRYCSKTISGDQLVQFKSGEKIGTVGGRYGQNMLDMGAYDYRRDPLPFIEQDSYMDHYYFTACPLDYFQEPLATELKALLGHYKGSPRRSQEPVCGKIMYDVPGTVQGNWFFDLDPYPEDPHLSLVYDNVYPGRGVISVGISFGENLPAGKYPFEPQDAGLVNRQFQDISPDGKVYCYDHFLDIWRDELKNRMVLLHMVDDHHLKIEGREGGSCGEGPWTLTDQAQTFSRTIED